MIVRCGVDVEELLKDMDDQLWATRRRLNSLWQERSLQKILVAQLQGTNCLLCCLKGMESTFNTGVYADVRGLNQSARSRLRCPTRLGPQRWKWM